MKYFVRGAIVLLLLALPLVAASAQDDEPINITGSQTVTDLLQSLLQDADFDISYEVTGSTGGFSVFCVGESDVTTATRPISVEEEEACQQAGITFDEYLLGYSAIAFVASPEIGLECITPGELDTILSPGAQGNVMTWEDTFIEGVSGPLSVVLLPDSSTQYFQLDQLLGGLGLRTDVITVPQSAGVITTVAENEGTIGLINAALGDQAENVTVLQLQNPELDACFAPSLETIESRQYSAVDRLFVYVNSTDGISSDTEAFLNQVVTTDAAASIAEAGFLAPSEAVYETNAAILAGNAEGGRQFTRDVTAFTIPDSIFGAINIAGGSNLAAYLEDATTQFSASYPAVTLNSTIFGEPSGRRALCNDQASILAATGSLPAESVENCAANNINTYELDLGTQAVVLLANAEDDFLACLNTPEIQTLWGIPADDATPIETWNQVNANFPESDIALVAPTVGAASADFMLTAIADVPLPLRTDTDEQKADPLYRAAAVANVPGAVTFMTWAEYLQVVESEQAGIQLIAVDGGNGCVAPSEETTLDGTYPVSQGNKLIVNRNALTRSEVQSFLWFLLSDENYSLIEDQGFIGLDFSELPMLREEIQTVFNEAIAAAAIPVEPEATAEPAPESTAEAVDAEASDAEATEVAVPEETPETTPEATEETE